ncbi:MAG: hypothetical protein B1H04_06355 [Planctomycetales bacterium 4484_123]|nr:MAG: hypothetical protein B1H04_06355 [Planctomycetales bacterium 4484_123]
MARKKHAKSLFEVITETSRRSGPPAELVPPTPPAGGAPAPVQAPPSGEPVLSTAGGRLRISLSQAGAAVLFGFLAALLVLVFLWGRRVGQASAGSRPGQVVASGAQGRGSLVPRPGAPGAREGPATSRAAPRQPARKSGYNYLVIQDGIRTLREAQDIQRFLYRRGITATVERSRYTPFYRVKDTRGFKRPATAQIKAHMAQHKAQIERLGDEYRNQGGRYGFKKPWFETEP